MALRDVEAPRHARPTLTEEQLRPTERWRKIRALAEAFAHERGTGEVIAAGLAYPLDAYDQFRRDVAIRPPPAPAQPSPPIRVLVDARRAAPFLLRATLRSLQDQSISDWSATVLASEELRVAPVASFAQTDERVAFAPWDLEQDAGEGIAILLDAGTVLDPETLAWLSFVLLRTGAGAAYADHDLGVADPAFRILRADPVLYGTFDEALIAAGPAPAVIAVSGAIEKINENGVRDRRAMLIDAGRRGSVAHVPRLLATQLSLPLVARTGRAEPDDAKPGRLAPLVLPEPLSIPSVPRDDRIAVVIPTRDGAGLLSRAIAALRATARQPERLDIVVVDNRSIAADTATLFRRLEKERTARIVPFDAPFNWSLASNLGAASSDAPLIVFANNDVEMLSPGWDDAVADALSAAQVGAVGARLLYPDRTIQHAGIAFGFGPGGAEHEGRGIPAVDPGPGRRYAIRHAVSALTGAFLAVRRGDFHRVNGFDAGRLMIAHSDVDFCLRLRELGRTILYCPEIEAIHHEGATRGRNQTKVAIAWDEGERMDLLERWGAALAEDPGISPYWQRGERPFDLLREPTTREILAQIDRSASDYPWMPSRSDPS
ncbi:glycosyltransferase [Sphingomonas sp. CCH5-D11]|uniref:glycosyltransferase n=1 Tax=Sphingomonas sp. CCH5-D11 TaxID=1768786 RepID=UPI00082E1534|nr:glycosyltransferase [Sphingomonas sp. CCH5-D11]